MRIERISPKLGLEKIQGVSAPPVADQLLPHQQGLQLKIPFGLIAAGS